MTTDDMNPLAPDLNIESDRARCNGTYMLFADRPQAAQQLSILRSGARGAGSSAIRFAVKPKWCNHFSFNSRQRKVLWSTCAMTGGSGVGKNEE